MNKKFSDATKIGLALSGGGVRAVAFHAGVMLWLAENNQLEKVHHISSVSGGSLFTGLVFRESNRIWPTSSQYINKVYPNIKGTLTITSLQRDAILRLLLNPLNWRFFFSRANVVARSIEELWGVQGNLGQLPKLPIWSINGTTAENGKRFRLKSSSAGDYEIGYADFSNFGIAKAMAISAAFPGGIGPFVIDSSDYIWRKYRSPEICNPSFDHLHIYDGGLYDNLGMEPFFDIGNREIKSSAGEVNFIIVSDAGAPLARMPIRNIFRLLRIKRFMNIVMDQARSLRVRVFVDFLQKNTKCGMYLQIGSNPVAKLKKFLKDSEKHVQDEASWLTSEETSYVASLPTTLDKMTENEFDQAARHGYETMKWNFIAFVE
jgi:NTE family protein